MAIPTLTPKATESAITLPATASFNGSAAADSHVAAACPIGFYTSSVAFITGAVAQVAYTYKKLGGDVLDIEMPSGSVFANYEEAVLEYSYLVNVHQSKNAIGSMLGAQTASFGHQGEVTTGPDDVALKYPRYSFESAFRIADIYSTEAISGGDITIHSASFASISDQQDYDLQSLISSLSTDDSTVPFYGKVGSKKVKIHQVFYVSPKQMWRFYGYYGGLNVVGDFNNYGQYADDSSWQVIPAWQNKLQAISYEDHLYTRTSHYSYEVINNKLRVFPTPNDASPERFWVRFSIKNENEPWESDYDTGEDGINNMNTLPFENIPYESINSIGKQWIRRFALALSKETLGQIRGKFGGSIPVPGDNITLNSADLLGQAKEEQNSLREELKTQLDEMTYQKIAASDAEVTENASKVIKNVPLKIFVG